MTAAPYYLDAADERLMPEDPRGAPEDARHANLSIVERVARREPVLPLLPLDGTEGEWM